LAGLRYTERFQKAFHALGPEQQQRAAKSLELFEENPRHPSLHFEKLTGSVYRTIRVDRNHRIVLREADDGVFDLLDVGTHDYVYRRFG
jgi:hypothetical protein